MKRITTSTLGTLLILGTLFTAFNQALAHTVVVSPFEIDLSKKEAYLSAGLQEMLVARLSSKEGMEALMEGTTPVDTRYTVKGKVRREQSRKGIKLVVGLYEKPRNNSGTVKIKDFQRSLTKIEDIVPALDEISKAIAAYILSPPIKKVGVKALDNTANKEGVASGAITMLSSKDTHADKAQKLPETSVEEEPIEIAPDLPPDETQEETSNEVSHGEKDNAHSKTKTPEDDIQYAPDLPPEDQENGSILGNIIPLLHTKKEQRPQKKTPKYVDRLPFPTPEELMAEEEDEALSTTTPVVERQRKAKKVGLFSRVFGREEPSHENTVKTYMQKKEQSTSSSQVSGEERILPRWKWY